MRHLSKPSLFFISVASIILLSGIVLAFVFDSQMASGLTRGTSQDEVPPLPTPGPEPTSPPDSLEGAVPILTREDAIKQAILLDQAWTTREVPLQLEDLIQDNDSILVEHYSTRQEASDLYGFGTLTDIERASEPVWVIVIKGPVTVNTTKGPIDSDGITFIISQNTGYLLSMGAAAIEKEVR